MEKNTLLEIGEILQLDSEINGFTNPQTGEQVYEGFLKQNLSIILKYELTELSEELSKERKRIEGVRDELIQKLGEKDENGGIIVRMFDEVKDDEGIVIGKKYTENYIEFDNQYGELMKSTKEISHPDITKEDLKKAGDTKDDYKVLFKLIKKNI